MPNSSASDRHLVLALHAAAARIERRLDRALSAIKGVSFSEYLLLRALGTQHGATATRVDLASAVGLTPSGVTRALRPLEKLGYVKTTKDARDARRSLAKLTPVGEELVADGSGVVADSISGLAPVTSLSAADRKRILGMLEELSGV